MQIFLVIVGFVLFFIFFILPTSLYLAFWHSKLPFYVLATVLEINYSKLSGSLSSGITVHDMQWHKMANLKRLHATYEYDSELNIFHIKKLFAANGTLRLQESPGLDKKSTRDENTEKKYEEMESDLDSGEFPSFKVDNLKIENIKIVGAQNFSLNKLIMKNLVISEEEFNIEKFSLHTKNIRAILKKAGENMFFKGWYRTNIKGEKQKFKLAVSSEYDGEKNAKLISPWFDASLLHHSSKNMFKLNYIRKLGRNDLKLPPISKFSYDFALNSGEFHIGKNQYRSTVSENSSLVFVNKDDNFPLFINLNGLNFGLAGGELTAEQLGMLWFEKNQMTDEELSYISGYLVK